MRGPVNQSSQIMCSGNERIAVNSFWHGAALPLNSWLCLKSFIDHGIAVSLYCYEPIEVPPGVDLRDAGQILPRSRLFACRTGPRLGSVNAFSDLFRYKQLFEKGGWWVDTDVLCLQATLPSQPLVFGWESEHELGTAVLKFPRGHWLVEKLYIATEAIIEGRGNSLQWGEIGPSLLTYMVREHGLMEVASPSQVIYPISYSEFDVLLRPEKLEYVQRRTNDSIFLHLWQEMHRRAGLKPSTAPPIGSYLAAMFARHGINHSRISTAVNVSPDYVQRTELLDTREPCLTEAQDVAGHQKTGVARNLESAAARTFTAIVSGRAEAKDYTIAVLDRRVAERERELTNARTALDKAHEQLIKQAAVILDYKKIVEARVSATVKADGRVARRERELTNVRTALDKAHEQLTKQAAVILDYEKIIETKDSAILQADGRVAERDSELTNVRTALDKAHEQLTKQAAVILDYENIIRTKDSAILQADRALGEAQRAVQQRDDVIWWRDAQITELHANVIAQAGLLTEIEGFISNREIRIAQLEARSIDVALIISDSQRTTANRDQTIQSFEELLASRQQEIFEVRRALDEAHRELTKHSIALRAALEQEIPRLRLQSLQLQDQLYRFEMSTCWRLTAPLRSRFVQSIYRKIRVFVRALLSCSDRNRQDGRGAQHIIRRAGGQGDTTRITILSGEQHTPGHLYRVERFATAAAAAGAEITIVALEDLPYQGDKFDGVQIVFMWRVPWSDSVAKIVNNARLQQAVVIFDIDDLMIDPHIAKKEIIDGIRSLELEEDQVQKFYERILLSLVNSDFGVAPTTFLAHRMRAYQKPVFIVPNGFDAGTLARSRLELRARRATPADGIVRIGYAAGTRTHQRDFRVVAGAVARVLREHRQARLVLFQHDGVPVVSPNEFPVLNDVRDQIEWRELVNLAELPRELARFSINLAPLEIENAFCEAKSELKFFEAALVEVPTIASPTETYRTAIRDKVTGLLADNEQEWYETITSLLLDNLKRDRLGQSAYHDVLWRYGPEQRLEIVSSLIEQTCFRGARAARSFRSDISRQNANLCPLPSLAAHKIIFERDNLKPSKVTIMIPLYNYEDYVKDALDSAREQTLADLDLVVVDDGSADASMDVAKAWMEKWSGRFNRAVLVRNERNSGLALARNIGFARAETPYVLPLDADNLLMPPCVENCLIAIDQSHAAFVFPKIETFGLRRELIGCFNFDPARFVAGNYIDAMALIRKAAWAAVGGYEFIPFGWEDYDFWCKLIEHGFWGSHVPELLAQYRVHDRSMLAKSTDLPVNKVRLMGELEKRHPWLRLHRTSEWSSEALENRAFEI
jgi:glycosyltransferase involved in cell wall biosynthesis